MALYDKKTEFGYAKRTADSYTECETRHKVKVYYTDMGEALKDYIIVEFEAKDSSGYLETSLHQDNAYGHKIRIKIYNNDKKVYEDDIEGGQGYVTATPYLINGEGVWSAKVSTVSAGGCTKPSGTDFLGSFLARKKLEESNDESNDDSSFDDSSSSGDSVFDNTLLIGGVAVFLFLAGIKKVRKG